MAVPEQSTLDDRPLAGRQHCRKQGGINVVAIFNMYIGNILEASIVSCFDSVRTWSFSVKKPETKLAQYYRERPYPAMEEECEHLRDAEKYWLLKDT